MLKLRSTLSSLALLSLLACDKGTAAAEAGAKAKTEAAPASAKEAGLDGAFTQPATEDKPAPPKPEPVALSAATLASSTQCKGEAGCVPDAVLALVHAQAKEESESKAKPEGLTQTLTTDSDGSSLHWLSYELPFAGKGMQFDTLVCRAAIEVREGATPKEIFHACEAECMLDGQLVDLIGSDLPELVLYCGPAQTGGLDTLEIYALTPTGWAKVASYTPPCDAEDPEGESHYSFSREGIELRCHNIDDAGETVIEPPVMLRWTGREFAAL